MSQRSFFTGGIIGAAIVYLTCTEKGKAILKEGLDYIDRKLEKIQGDAEKEAQESTVTEEE